MGISIAHTDRGMILGDFTENEQGDYIIHNPTVVQLQQQGVALFPLLGICEEKEITIKANEVRYGGIFTPTADLRNHYSEKYGTGLQLITS